MNTIEVFEALKVYLLQNHNAKLASGGKEITKKCHICGDSKDPSSRHMYIGMRDGAIVYNCFKCNSSGVVNSEFLRGLDCSDLDLMKMCNANTLSNYRIYKNESFEQNSKFYIPKITFTDTPGNAKKLASINKRMGIDFSNRLNEFKIVLNLKEFLTNNGINKYTRHHNIIEELSQFFIGFLSTNNKYVYLRRLVPEDRVHPSIRSRYVKYNIFDLDTSDYYILPKIVNPYSLNIYIAEGPFDIIGVYILNNSSNIDNAIYGAIGGKSYLGFVKYFIQKYGLISFTLHIYADNDIEMYELEKINNFLRPYGNKIYVHFNTFPNEKDFGVDKMHIIDSVKQL